MRVGAQNLETVHDSQDSPSSSDSTFLVNRLAQLALGLIPVLVAALAAIGSATSAPTKP